MKLLILESTVGHYGKVIKPLDDSCSLVSSVMTKPPRLWKAHGREASNIRDFSRVALSIEIDRGSLALTLGEPSDQGLEMIKRKKRLKRSKETIKDRAQNLIILDVEYDDGLAHLSDLERLERYIQLLPDYYHGSSYHYQFSSSHRLKTTTDSEGDKLRVHLFFWAAKPIKVDQLKRHLEGLNREHHKELIDTSPANHSGALIMSRPTFKRGVTDPVQQRSGLIIKRSDEVQLPDEAYKRELAPSTRPLSYIPRGFIEENPWARGQLDNVCGRATALQDGRNTQVFSDAKWLGQIIGAEMLDEHEVTQRLIQAYEINGLVKKRGFKDVHRSILNGLEEGKRNPVELRSYEPPARPAQSIIKTSAPITLKPSKPEEVQQQTQQLINDAINKAQPRVISIAQSMTGAGKTRALVSASIELHRSGHSVIYLTRNHRLIRGDGGLLSRYAELGAEPDIWEGKTRRCEEMKRIKADAQRLNTTNALTVLNDYKELIEENPIPQFCREVNCSRFNTNQCSVWSEGARPIEGRLIIAPQAYLSDLVKREEKGELPENLVIIIDERHDLIHTTGYELDLIKAMSSRKEDQRYLDDRRSGRNMPHNPSAEFRATHPLISDFASRLNGALNRLVRQIKPNQYGVTERLTTELISSIDPHLRESAERALRYIQAVNPKVERLDKRALKRDQIQRVIRGERVKASGLRAVTDLAQLLTSELDPLHALHLSVNAGGAEVQRRVIQPLPESVKVILADATPTESWVNFYAQRLGFRIELTSSDINPHPVEGCHIETKQMTQTALFDAKSDGLNGAAVKSLSNLAHPVSIMLRKLNEGDEVGLIASKRLHDEITEALSGRGALANSQLISTLSRFKVKLGYYGRDERGSNEFEECRALLMLGKANPNVNAMRADIEALTMGLMNEGADTDEVFHDLYREHTDSATVQAFGRLRSVWRSGLIFIHATDKRVDRLKGVNWHSTSAQGARTKNGDVELRAHKHLDQGELISIKLLTSWGASKGGADRIIKRISGSRALTQVKRKQQRGRAENLWFDPETRGRSSATDEVDQTPLTLIPTSQKWSNERGAEEDDLSHQVLKPDRDEGSDLLIPISQKWSDEDIAEDEKRAVLSFSPYIYIKGLMGKKNYDLYINDLGPFEALCESSAHDREVSSPLSTSLEPQLSL